MPLAARHCSAQTGLVCRYLYTEWEDPGFGPRAATVHTQFTQNASEPLKEAISNQMQLVAQLKHINTEIKVGLPKPLSCSGHTMEWHR